MCGIVAAVAENNLVPVLVEGRKTNKWRPYNFPEKLIPLVIHNAISGNPLPIYSDGQQIRNWLYVKDGFAAIRSVLEVGRVGKVNYIGGWIETPNLEVVKTLCPNLDQLQPRSDDRSYDTQITYLKDRPWHDQRDGISY